MGYVGTRSAADDLGTLSVVEYVSALFVEEDVGMAHNLLVVEDVRTLSAVEDAGTLLLMEHNNTAVINISKAVHGIGPVSVTCGRFCDRRPNGTVYPPGQKDFCSPSRHEVVSNNCRQYDLSVPPKIEYVTLTGISSLS